jgi:uncharacterized integral membrane protein
VFRLIVSVLILVLLAVLFIFNGGPDNQAEVNLFGYRMQNVPIIAVAVAGFILGVLYSFVLYFLRFVARRRKASLQERDRAVRDRERSLRDREKELDTMAESLQDARADGSGAAENQEPEGKRRRGAR